MFTGIVEDLGEVETVDQQGDFARIRIRSAIVASDARPGDSICVSGVCLTVTAVIGLLPAPEGKNPPPSGKRPRMLHYPSNINDVVNSPDRDKAEPLGFTADVMGETLRRSSLKSLSPGTRVNLERSVRLEDRLGGHLVQGHTDGTGTIQSRVSHQDWDVVRISLPADLARYVVHKGSITVDGVSLTVSALSSGGDDPPQTPPAHGGATRPPIPPGPPGRGEEPPQTSPGPPGRGEEPPQTSPGPPGGGEEPPVSSGPAGPGDWFEVSLIPETLKRTTLGSKQPGDEVNLEVDVIAKYVEKLIGGTR